MTVSIRTVGENTKNIYTALNLIEWKDIPWLSLPSHLLAVVLGRKTLGPIPSKLPTFSRLKSKKSNPGEPQVEENCRIWYKVSKAQGAKG
ncbi:hypothetical protein G9A89_003689 [Geosiphon pyriformis]|nr:hypothetical protein G9A89_003689 [Geosiphon pyriformis]